ncbi:MAG: glutamate 5-kinase [Opitutae bacterium]|jgi:glutamate 5-kinase|nr:glutamate 5-kinase [Opitutae bacterium]
MTADSQKPSIGKVSRLVVKLGTGVLSPTPGAIEADRLRILGESVRNLRKEGVEVIIVSSGAVGLGMAKLGLSVRPSDLSTLRACAAIGQNLLMDVWREALEPLDLIIAQMLLTREDFRSRKSSQNVELTLQRLLEQGAIPIINENDSVSDEEIRFGDNDVLSALLASLCKAEMLAILSTAPGLMTSPEDGEIIPFVSEITPAIEAMAEGTKSSTAVGGMVTKIEAAKIATMSGCAVFVGSGTKPDRLPLILKGETTGTFFAPAGLGLNERKKWLAFFPEPSGTLVLDEGACHAILQEGKSLLAKGLVDFRGVISRSDVVTLENPDGEIIARGICRFNSDELPQVKGKSNDEIHLIFPERTRTEVIHRDHLAPLR